MSAARIIPTLLLLLGCTTAGPERDHGFEQGRSAVDRARQLVPRPGPARNVILFLGDGMGVSTVTAARILEGQLRGEPGEENLLSFERLPYLALAKTYNTNQQTPDSAGTMTAIVTGSKTRAGVLGVDASVRRGDFAGVEGHRLKSLFQLAEERGMATGVVTTTRLTHATPAACFAHSPERSWEDDSGLSQEARAAGFPDIARQLIEYPHGDGLEIALGGGLANFLPAAGGITSGGRRSDGRDLTAEWLARRPGSHFVTDRNQLAALDPSEARHVLGLFALSHLSFDADRAAQAPAEPSIEEMTAAAIEILSRRDDGYVLMVEGGRIDHAHHGGNAYRALTDTVAFARAVARALTMVDLDDTLVLVTADHSHVFTFAGYPIRGNPILGKVRHNDEDGEPGELARDLSGLPYTTLGYQNGAGYIGDAHSEAYHSLESTDGSAATERLRPDLTHVDTTHPDYLQEATVPLLSETHGGEDVAVYAAGPGADRVHGVMEQNALFHVMTESLGWNRPPPPARPSPNRLPE